jgi:hypothetical protein
MSTVGLDNHRCLLSNPTARKVLLVNEMLISLECVLALMAMKNPEQQRSVFLAGKKRLKEALFPA